MQRRYNMKKISMVINADDRLGHISPEIYGHFSEHLGRCIYNGIYVGENSPIPNTDGIRNDIIEAFRNIKAPVPVIVSTHRNDLPCISRFQNRCIG